MSDKAFDIDELLDTDEIELTITNPKNGDPVIAADDQPWKIRLAGPNHAESIKLRNSAIGKQMKRERTRAGADLDPSEITEESLESMVKRTLGWNAPIMGGQPYEFSPDNARKLYRSSQFVRLQVQKRFSDEAGFTKGSAKA